MVKKLLMKLQEEREKNLALALYPALKNLREMGFISSDDEKEGKTIVYTLTERGKNALRISKRRYI
jgi:DNA-binding PadR family transcriptional regulator